MSNGHIFLNRSGEITVITQRSLRSLIAAKYRGPKPIQILGPLPGGTMLDEMGPDSLTKDSQENLYFFQFIILINKKVKGGNGK